MSESYRLTDIRKYRQTDTTKITKLYTTPLCGWSGSQRIVCG